jgi:hypothetical protein
MTDRPDHRAPSLTEIAENPTVQALYTAQRATRTDRQAIAAWAAGQPSACHREAARLLVMADQWEQAIPVLIRLADQSDRQIAAARYATRNLENRS